MNRNTVISISKGIAIILMVIAHAEAPAWLCKFIFEFHMPLFFITAGYFFSLKYLNDEATFVKKRIKGLYVPFVKWSVVFLALHNLMFEIGILNETYGTRRAELPTPTVGTAYSRTYGTFLPQWVVTTSFYVVHSGSSEGCLWPASYTLLYIR